MVARATCLIMGGVFLIVALWGFIDGSRVLIFHVNTTHNLVHLVSGLTALGFGLSREPAARAFCFVFGAVYGLVAALGFLGFPVVVSVLAMNMADNWLHTAIALVFLIAGSVSLAAANPRPVIRATHHTPAGSAA